jgi:hypothetical protein
MNLYTKKEQGIIKMKLKVIQHQGMGGFQDPLQQHAS